MSFILDALKKSERERQRQTGPALFEVKVAPPRNRFPLWAVAIGVLLILNSGVVIWLLLHNKAAPAQSNAPAAVASAPSNSGATPYGAPPSGQAPWPPASSTPYQANSDTPPASGGAEEYFGDPAGFAPDRRPDSAQNESPATADATDEPRLKRNTPDDEMLNPEDYEPAAEAPRSARTGSARKPRANKKDTPAEEGADPAEKGLPSYQDAVAMPGMNMPELRLDLHVYDPPDKSFVLVNMRKVKAGETIAQGVHVDQITPSGAIMTYRGVRFLLHSE
jgi:general secretion pathway protein B